MIELSPEIRKAIRTETVGILKRHVEADPTIGHAYAFARDLISRVVTFGIQDLARDERLDAEEVSIRVRQDTLIVLVEILRRQRGGITTETV